jgi:glycosyltransferase involved in cell wall biosynthesis
MYSGATDPRKNMKRLIGAYSKLPKALKAKYQLVLAGGMPHRHRLILDKIARKNNIESNRIVITGRIDDNEMVALYRLSKCFVFPSYHEGFGLPALEAMACGTAVIGSNISSIPEVIGRDDAMFDPFSEADIADKMMRVLSDLDFRDELAQYGLERAKLFSWNEVANRSIKAFEKCHNERRISVTQKKKNRKNLSQMINDLVDIKHPLLHDNDLITAAYCLGKLIPRRDSRPRLYIDISELHAKGARTGIQRVVRSVILPLLKYPPEGWVVRPVYATPTHGYRHAAKFTADLIEGIPTPEDDAVIDPREGDFFLGLDFQCNIVFSQYKFFNYLRNIGVRVKFVVYDMLPIKLCEHFSESVKENFERWLRIIIESDGAICISQAVSNELSDWVESRTTSRLRAFDISWFHLGADIENTIPTRGLSDDCHQVLAKIKSRPSFLLVGTLEPRKGHLQAIKAFEKIWGKGIHANLVMVGKLGWKMGWLAKQLRGYAEFGSNLIWLENISDEYIEKVYEASTCLIAASQGEGFGLPLIEAAKHKLPIIARDIHVFREVAGEHAYYFAGTNPEKLATAIIKWMELNDRKEIPDISGMHWLTWEKSVEQLKCNIFKGCVEGPQQP